MSIRTAVARSDARLTGILLLCTGIFVLTLQDVIVRLMSGRYPLPELLAIRSVFALPALLAFTWFDGGLTGLRSPRLALLLLRGALLLLCFTAYYLAIATIPLAEAIALCYSAPLFIVLLSGPLLGEHVSVSRWIAVAAGFAGVVIVCHPGPGVIEPAAVLALASAVFYGSAQVMARGLGHTERASVMAFFQNLVFLSAALTMGVVTRGGAWAHSEHTSVMFLLRAWVVPNRHDLLLIAVTGPVAAVGSVCLTQAYRVAEATVVAPFEYTAITWAVLWGLLLWGERPAASTVIGIGLIVFTGIYVLGRGGRVVGTAGTG